MSHPDPLSGLVEAEKGAQPPAAQVEKGWQRLTHSLSAGVAPLPGIAAGQPLQLAAWGLTPKLVGLCLLGAVTVGAVQVSGLMSQGTTPSLGSAVRGRSATTTPSLPGSVPGPLAPQPSTGEPARAPDQDASQARRPAPSTVGMGPPAIQSPGPSSSTAEAPAAEPTPGRAVAAFPLPSEPTPTASTFEVELELLKQAKAELDSQRGAAALRLLEEHASRFPRGVFAGERHILRALALCQSGRATEGRRLAESFIRKQPGSPLAERLRRACALASPEASE